MTINIDSNQFSRRERKAAATRVGLVQALAERLDARSLDAISVRELAEAVDVSDATFFNYFATKLELALYFIQLWSLDVGARAEQALAEGSVRQAVDEVFNVTAAGVRERPGLFGEIIAVQARLPADAAWRDVPLLDRLLVWPDRPEVLAQSGQGLDGLFPRLIAEAVARGELPPDADQSAGLLGLVSIFFGVPLVLARRAPEAVQGAYAHQLRLWWRAHGGDG
ncbi:MAG: TetR family transcriptional regulator [Pseudomonadota bacterium]|nr:TetR family transcriptional regulator [Pseudomonadota bacterium]